MASERSSFFQEDQEKMKPVCGWEEVKGENGGGRSSRGRKSNGKGPKKQPQRGLGVEQLEKLRMQECLKKAAEASGIPVPSTYHHHQYQYHQQHLLQQYQYQYHHPQVFANGNNVPVRYGTPIPIPSPPPNGFQFHHCPQSQPQQVMMMNDDDNNNNNNSGFGPFIGNGNKNMLSGGACCYNSRVASSSANGSGSLLVRNPLETSKELSSMPNLHSSDQSFHDLSHLKRSDRPLEAWSNNNVHDINLGFVPQPPAAAAASAYATPNHEEGVEIVAVHRRGNSANGKVFMEYEFFPGKDGRAAGTTSKELELSTIGSAEVGGSSEASSSITFTTYGDTPPSNSIDLSLKL